ncbi:hypothetical protein [Micromonospora sp. CB01531]|uniref:hypothetical protein n=1 Tax=Micromonospora sp. CB01531 TaxID=1718947 RepID=UPI000939AD92|nr:hypothetical protein [Micromonospora sp. CB01531]OKI52873.1 hypothetical protein A6A27_08270 [Micromonospora sp. CB01531]
MTITVLPHPDWCEPTLCDAEVPTLPASGGVHRSSPQRLVLTLPHGDAVLVVAQLQRPGSLWFGETERKRRTLDQAADQQTALAVQLGGGPITFVPIYEARMLVTNLAPLLGLTVEATSGV